jgi:hypothetical protein
VSSDERDRFDGLQLVDRSGLLFTPAKRRRMQALIDSDGWRIPSQASNYRQTPDKAAHLA